MKKYKLSKQTTIRIALESVSLNNATNFHLYHSDDGNFDVLDCVADNIKYRFMFFDYSASVSHTAGNLMDEESKTLTENMRKYLCIKSKNYFKDLKENFYKMANVEIRNLCNKTDFTKPDAIEIITNNREQTLTKYSKLIVHFESISKERNNDCSK